MYRRILVPTDGSTGVERAVEHATDLAIEHDGAIHTVYVVNTASFATLPMETSWEGISDMLRDEGKEAIERVRDLATRRGINVKGSVVEGSPSREIVTCAVERDCDLVVMGTHGRGGLNRLLLGSVTERVVRSSPIPVLTIRVRGDRSEDPNPVESRARGG